MSKYYFVRKKENYRSKETVMLKELQDTYEGLCVDSIAIYNFYELINFNDEMLEGALSSIIVDPVVDDVYEDLKIDQTSYLIEPLPSQFDQRRESAMDCVKLLGVNAKDYDIKTGVLYVLNGICEDDFKLVKPFFLNPIENRIKVYNEVVGEFAVQPDLKLDLLGSNLGTIFDELNLSMDFNDFEYLVNEFNAEGRIPTVGEVKILDTYWSDHCRHTTFNTVLTDVMISDEKVLAAFNEVKDLLKDDVTLMNIATLYPKYAIKNGLYTKKEPTKEDNAISIIIEEDSVEYLLQFKNETHNHPTEIEPFGGAATCIGGAIRDPLSGRAYVYQGVRIAGVGNVFEKPAETLKDKLYQRTISKKAALGFSSYGNQIGIPTLYNKEIFHPSYVAKHLELGCVVGVCPRSSVTRAEPTPGDLIIMLGGKTGRDGIGGATGSSKLQKADALVASAAEVQKGNAPQQRNLVRLFSIPEFSKTIKKSNDFGAGGVSVCALELADGVDIYLDKVMLKDQQMQVIDIALSESQERMAIIIDPKDLALVEALCVDNNVYYANIGTVTSSSEVNMYYHDDVYFKFSRRLLDSGGAKKYQEVIVNDAKEINFNLYENDDIMFSDRNLSTNKVQDEFFDATVLANTVLMPYGGQQQNIKTQVAMAKIKGLKTLKSVVSYGFNPLIMEQDGFEGSQLAVVDSVCKQVTVGVSLDDICLSFQEYFKSLNQDATRFASPLKALLGAYQAQKGFNIPALGGKDSMSGTYQGIDVVDTFVSFALGVKKDEHVIQNFFVNEGEYIYLLNPQDPLDYNELKSLYNKYLGEYSKITSAYTLGDDPMLAALVKMSGDGIGFDVKTTIDELKSLYGAIIFTSSDALPFEKIGVTIKGHNLFNDKVMNKTFSSDLFTSIYPNYDTRMKLQKENIIKDYDLNPKLVDEVKVLIPIFEGTNSYLELQDEFVKLGCKVELLVINDKYDIDACLNKFIKILRSSQILAIPGGFSKSDEPDGSGKFIVNFLNNSKVRTAIEQHLSEDKLIFGVCNGFQALLKSGLLTPNLVNQPTLFYNDAQIHISTISDVLYQENKSPFFTSVKPGIYKTPISHGEGKFCIDELMYEELLKAGQVVSTYANFNPNQSDYNIEGILSPCGKVYGKMGHIERCKDGLYQNVIGTYEMKIFASMVNYFKGEIC